MLRLTISSFYKFNDKSWTKCNIILNKLQFLIIINIINLKFFIQIQNFNY